MSRQELSPLDLAFPTYKNISNEKFIELMEQNHRRYEGLRKQISLNKVKTQIAKAAYNALKNK